MTSATSFFRRDPMSFPVLTLLAVLALALSAPTAARAAAPAVGDAVPDLALSTIDDSKRVLSAREDPTVLIFFRGTW